MNIKKIFGIAALATLITTPVFAADMPLKAPAPVAPAWSWTGFYLGINGGGVWSRDHLTSVPADPGTTACLAAGACPRDYGGSTGTSGEFGGQAGYNWQVNNILLGIETDAQWTNSRSSAAVALGNVGTGFVPFNGTATSKLDWFGTTRARLGFIAAPQWLFYATGGVAYGSISRTWTANFPTTGQAVAGTDRQGAVGWTAGLGTEWMFAQHWSAGVEWLYMQFESRSFGATGSASPGCTAANCNFTVSSGGLKANVARAKIDYHF
jgi:outer membrane immunogenic protein